MHSTICLLALCAALFATAQALDCATGDPCQLTGYFVPKKGYQCVQVGASALCTCPGGSYETDKPCRLCDRTNPVQNACNFQTPSYVACLETDAYGTAFVCLCMDASGAPAVTTSATCDLTVTLTSTAMTTTTTAAGGVGLCSNGGVFATGKCNCPSGYAGTLCEQKIDQNLCERIVCKNSGVCAIRNPTGPYDSVCFCRSGTWGDYCEMTGTLGTCTASSCLNSGVCRENLIATTRHAYCQCPAGYNGIKCETRYFTCSAAGNFPDTDMMVQGKYFQCLLVNGVLQAVRKSCPKGLKFNTSLSLCTL